MTKNHFIFLVSLLIATTLGSVIVVIKNVEYFSWYREEVVSTQEFLVERKEYEENILKKYPEEEITVETLSQMLQKENKKVLGDILILLPAKKKIVGILTDEITYSIKNPTGEKNISGKSLVELAQNGTILDLRGNPHFLDDKTKNIVEESSNNFIKESTFFGRLDGYKKYEEFYFPGGEESIYDYYPLKPLIIINIIYLLLFVFTVYWVRKCYRLTRKSKITARV